MADGSRVPGEKTVGSVGIALQRIGRGILGVWCIIGPIGLLFGYREFESGLFLLFAIVVVVFYTIAIWKWRNQGFGFLKAVTLDTLLTVVFSAIAGIFTGTVSAFHRGLDRIGAGITLIFVFLGFWILEMRRNKKRR